MRVGSLGWERSPGGGNGNPFQYSCLENPMDRGAWQAVVHGVKSWTRLNSCTHTLELVLLYKTHTHTNMYIYMLLGWGG